MVGVAVTLSTVIFFSMTNQNTNAFFLTDIFERSTESLVPIGVSKGCGSNEVSVLVKNTGGVDANIRSIAINDATNRIESDAHYDSNASSFSLIKGTTSGPIDNTYCNDSNYLDITSVFDGISEGAVANANFTSNANGWISSSSVSNGSAKLYLTMFTTQNSQWSGDYRALRVSSDSSNSDTAASFGTNKNKKFLFKPGQDNSQHSNPSNNPAGFGWRTEELVNGVISSGAWEFGLTLTAENLNNAEGYVIIRVFSAEPDKNLNQATLLFSLATPTNVLAQGYNGQTQDYVFTHNPGSQFSLTNRVLIVEYWLDVKNNNSGNNASITLTIGGNSYVTVPIVPAIDPIIHDPSTGNPAGSGPGSGKGVITSLSPYAAMGTVDYYFQYQFTTPAEFNSMSASYAWSYTPSIASSTKLNFARLIITDLSNNVITELHCDDNASGTCDGNAGWTNTVAFTYRNGIDSIFPLDASTNYRLIVHFQVENNDPLDAMIITLSVDDVGLAFVRGDYQASIIFNGSIDQTLSPSDLKAFLDSTFSTSGVEVSVQAYDYVIDDFAAEGAGLKDFVFATPGSDYHITMNLDPSRFMSNGAWKVKVTSKYAAPFTMHIDLLQVSALVTKPVLRDVIYVDGLLIRPGQTVNVNVSPSRPLDTDAAYRITIVTGRTSHSSVILS